LSTSASNQNEAVQGTVVQDSDAFTVTVKSSHKKTRLQGAQWVVAFATLILGLSLYWYYSAGGLVLKTSGGEIVSCRSSRVWNDGIPGTFEVCDFENTGCPLLGGDLIVHGDFNYTSGGVGIPCLTMREILKKPQYADYTLLEEKACNTQWIPDVNCSTNPCNAELDPLWVECIRRVRGRRHALTLDVRRAETLMGPYRFSATAVFVLTLFSHFPSLILPLAGGLCYLDVILHTKFFSASWKSPLARACRYSWYALWCALIISPMCTCGGTTVYVLFTYVLYKFLVYWGFHVDVPTKNMVLHLVEENSNVSLPYQAVQGLCSSSFERGQNFYYYLANSKVLTDSMPFSEMAVLSDGVYSTVGEDLAKAIAATADKEAKHKTKGKISKSFHGWAKSQHSRNPTGGGGGRRNLSHSEYTDFCNAFDHDADAYYDAVAFREQQANLHDYSDYVARRNAHFLDTDSESSDYLEREGRCRLCAGASHGAETCFEASGHKAGFELCDKEGPCGTYAKGPHISSRCPRQASCVLCLAVGDHWSSDCPKHAPQPCGFCGKHYHTEETCFKRLDAVKAGYIPDKFPRTESKVKPATPPRPDKAKAARLAAFAAREEKLTHTILKKESAMPSSFDSGSVALSCGIVTHKGESIGTAFHAGGLILTAYHVVADIMLAGIGSSLVQISWADPSVADCSVTAYSTGAKSTNDVGNDVAVLRIKGQRPKGLKLHPNPAQVMKDRTHTAAVPGFTLEGGVARVRAFQGTASQSHNLIVHTCSTEPGGSGSPVVIGSNNHPVVVGVHGWTSGKKNGGPLLHSEMQAAMKSWDFVPMAIQTESAPTTSTEGQKPKKKPKGKTKKNKNKQKNTKVIVESAPAKGKAPEGYFSAETVAILLSEMNGFKKKAAEIANDAVLPAPSQGNGGGSSSATPAQGEPSLQQLLSKALELSQ
jgi:hypothetical protein